MDSNPSIVSQILGYLVFALGIFGIVMYFKFQNKILREANKDKGPLIQDFDIRGAKLLNENMHGDKVIVKLKGAFGEGLVFTDKRLYVLKWGYMAGNFFGGRCLSFEYKNIVGLEIRKGWRTGTFQILTPANQDTQKSYWGSATSSDNTVAFFSRDFKIFQEAVKVGRDLLHNPKVNITQNSQAIPVTTNYSDLEKLAELKDKGIITKEEFEAKKKKILDL